MLERRLASLEGGSAALSLASGMAAISGAFLNLCRAGDNIVSVQTLYGGTTDLLQNVLTQYGIPVVIDNTFATPYLFRPFEHGVDIACYPATKYLGGHGTTIAGMVTESGRFNWLNGRFPQFEEFYDQFRGKIEEEKLLTQMFTQRFRAP